MKFRKYKYMILRRFTQISILSLYILANVYGLKILEGNLSSSVLFGVVPLSDPFAVLQMFVAGSVLSFDILLGAFIVTMFYLLIGGRAFCSWVCPINIITDTAGFLRAKLGLAKVQKRVFMSRDIRYYVLGISLVLSAIMGLAAFEIISPISMAHRGIVFGMGMGGGALVVIFLFDLLVHENGWCGYICPLGAFYLLNAKLSLIRVKHNADLCTECMRCKEVCPEKDVLFMVAKSSQSVLKGECTNCARCVEVCDDNALNFSIRSLAIKAKSSKNDIGVNNDIK